MSDELQEIIRKNIRDRRKALNMPLEELAQLVNLSSGYVGLIERGERRGTIETLHDIANALNIGIEELFKDSGFQSANPLAEKINSYLFYLDNDDCELLLEVCRFLKMKNEKLSVYKQHDYN